MAMQALGRRAARWAVTANNYGLLPRILSAPDAIERKGSSEVGRTVVRFIKSVGGRRYTAAFEVRTRRKMLALQSFWMTDN